MKKSAFTLTELVISTFLVVIIIGVVFHFGACNKSDHKKAEKSAVEFSKNLNNATGKVSCMRKDTDGDGYCGCSIFLKDGGILSVDCACDKYCFSCNEGCKVVNTIKVKEQQKNTNNINLR